MTSVRADRIPKIRSTFFQIAQFRIILQQLGSLLDYLVEFISFKQFLFLTAVMNPSCVGLIFDISDFCHDLLNLSFYKWSKSDHLVSHCEFMFIQVVLLRPHYLCIALINFICTPWLAIWGHKTRKTSEQFEVLIFDSAMGSVRNSFIVVESIWIKINVSID